MAPTHSLLLPTVARAAALALLLSISLLGARAANAQAPAGPAVEVPGTSGLSGVRCSAGTCYAVGSSGIRAAAIGVVVTLADGSVASVEQVPGTSGLSAIDCLGSTCYAVGSGGADLSTSGGVIATLPAGGPPSVQSLDGVRDLRGITCFTTTCLAAGSGQGVGVLVTISRDGSATVQDVPGTAILSAVVCPSSTCYATGAVPAPEGPILHGALVTIPAGGPAAVQMLSDTSALDDIACPGSTCYAVGERGGGAVVVPITSDGPGGAVTVSGAGALHAIDCTDDGACYAATFTDRLPLTGVVVTLPPLAGDPLSMVQGTSLLAGIACSGETCLAVGRSGEGDAAVGVVAPLSPSSS